jgi:NAD(P)-dependent dehydrogenase (short-subunit alcohol dehydrogenase family)
MQHELFGAATGALRSIVKEGSRMSQGSSPLVVVITGASSGIGRATAHAFAKRGVALLLAARRAPMLHEAARECVELGAAAALPVPTDVTQEDQVEALGRRALERFGRIDVWFNNAGVGISRRRWPCWRCPSGCSPGTAGATPIEPHP